MILVYFTFGVSLGVISYSITRILLLRRRERRERRLHGIRLLFIDATFRNPVWFVGRDGHWKGMAVNPFNNWADGQIGIVERFPDRLGGESRRIVWSDKTLEL